MSDPRAVASGGLFDFFISYKQKDSANFVTQLSAALRARGAEVWLDQVNMRPGDSILSGIENGINSSIDAVVILSENYFTGWSEEERRNLYALMVSKKLRIIPVWYKLELSDVETLAPMFAGIVSVPANTGSDEEARQVSDIITGKYDPKQRESRLYELFFRSVRRHVEDPDLDVFIGVFANDLKLLRSAVNAGANVNVTNTALWNRYNTIVTKHDDVFPAWRKLFLHLVATGQIRS